MKERLNEKVFAVPHTSILPPCSGVTLAIKSMGIPHSCTNWCLVVTARYAKIFLTPFMKFHTTFFTSFVYFPLVIFIYIHYDMHTYSFSRNCVRLFFASLLCISLKWFFKFSSKISTIFNNYKDAHVCSNLHNDLPLMFWIRSQE
jgi:hypothetical protein